MLRLLPQFIKPVDEVTRDEALAGLKYALLAKRAEEEPSHQHAHVVDAPLRLTEGHGAHTHTHAHEHAHEHEHDDAKEQRAARAGSQLTAQQRYANTIPGPNAQSTQNC